MENNMKEYEIKHEPTASGYYSKDGVFIQTGSVKSKYNIYFYQDGVPTGEKQLYSYDMIKAEVDIPKDYIKKQGSLTAIETKKIQASEIDIASVINEIKKEYVLTPKTK